MLVKSTVLGILKYNWKILILQIREAIIPIRELDATEEKSSNILPKDQEMIIMTESIDTDPERNEESSLSLVYLNNPKIS